MYYVVVLNMDVTGAIKAYLTLNCDYKDSFYNFILAIALFVPLALTFTFFGISYYTREIYYLTLSLALAFDYFINFFFTGLFLDPAPNPTCGGSQAYPSFLTQHSMFLYTFLLMSRQLFYLKLERHDVMFLQIWVLMTWVAALRLGYNNIEQAVIGAFIGQAFGLVAVTIVSLVVFYSREYIIYYNILQRTYYIDNIYKMHEKKTITKQKLSTLLAKSDLNTAWDELE